MNAREKTYKALKNVSDNVFQTYPEKDEQYPAIIYTYDPKYQYNLSGDTVKGGYLRVEIYTKDSKDLSILEDRVVEELYKIGYIFRSANSMAHPKYYNSIINLETYII